MTTLPLPDNQSTLPFPNSNDTNTSNYMDAAAPPPPTLQYYMTILPLPDSQTAQFDLFSNTPPYPFDTPPHSVDTETYQGMFAGTQQDPLMPISINEYGSASLAAPNTNIP